MASPESDQAQGRQLLVAVFHGHDSALQAVQRLIDRDFPPDRLSILGKTEAHGDDVLGISYHGVGDRMKSWGVHGAFWGGLWGLLMTATGVFVFPGLGAVFAIGPVVEILAGAATGAAVAGSAMAGAAAVSQLAVALHRMGVPEERLAHYHQAIDDGRYVILAICGSAEQEQQLHTQLGMWGADEVEVFDYT